MEVHEATQAAQVSWVQRNPGYFNDLYATYVKPWRRRKGMIKDAIPPEQRLQKLVLLIPDDRVEAIKDENDEAPGLSYTWVCSSIHQE